MVGKCIQVLTIAIFIVLNSSLYGITLVENGKSNYSIVIDTKASLSERHAAKELQMFLQMIAGAFIPIRQDNVTSSGSMILVGNSPKVQHLDNTINIADLGDEGFVIKTVGDDLILAGGKLRGSMYAVYTFLEDILGCRWYTSEVSKIPHMESIHISSLDIKQKPAFEYREPFWNDAMDVDWAARNKCNSSFASLDKKRGGKIDWPGVHTFYPLMPPEVHFENHPEWYSILSNNKRQWEYGQLCLTNPELQKMMAQKVKNQMSHFPDQKIFDVSQNDYHVACVCPPCKNLDEKEGSHAGSLIPFVNAVAERTSKEFPEKYVMTLAYTYTEIPPRYAKPGKNVIIRLCNMNHVIGCDAHPLELCERNGKFVDNLKNWSKIADKIYIWDYVTNFSNYLQPMPLWFANKKDLQFYYKCGVDGIFEQGCSPTEGAAGAELTAYLEAKLLWNPEADLNMLMNDFISGYYGIAAEPMKKYHQFLMDETNNKNIHFILYSPANIPLFSEENLQKMDAFLSEAEKIAGSDPVIANRVEEVRLNWLYVRLNQPVQHIIDGNIFIPAPGTSKYSTPKALEYFLNRIKDHEIVELWESRGIDIPLRYMKANVGTHKIITLENPYLKIQVIPSLNGRIYQMMHKKSGKNVFRVGTTNNRMYPNSGGYNDPYVADATWAFKVPENYEYILKNETDGQRIILTVKNYSLRLKQNTMEIQREIFLPAQNNELEITTTLKILTDMDQPQNIITNPEFDLGNFTDLSVGFKKGDGTFTSEEFPGPVELGYLSKEYRGKDIAGGMWGIFNKKENIGIVNSFSADQVEVCNIWADPRTNAVALRLQSPMKPGKAGDIITVKQKFRVVENQ